MAWTYTTYPWVPIVPASTREPAPTTHKPHQPTVPDYTLLLTGISCILSILGCIGIFTTFYRFPEYRSNSRKLLLYLTIADIFTAAGNLVGIVRYYHVVKVVTRVIDGCANPGLLCKVQSFVTTWSSLCSFFWMSVISIYFIIAIVKGRVATAEKMMIPSHLISWGIPVIIVSVAAGKDVLGEDLSYTSAGWCWITECASLPPATKITFMCLTGKLWEFACYLILIINYSLLKFFTWKKIRYRTVLNSRQRLTPEITDGESYLTHTDQTFVFVPIILIVLRIWGTVKFILSTIYTEVDFIDDDVYRGLEALTVLQGIGDSGQGFCNFLLFCVANREIRRKVFSFRSQNSPVYEDLDDSLTAGIRDESSDEEILVNPRSSLTSIARDYSATSRGYIT